MSRPLHEIAREIAANWRPVNYAAKPYLDAMFSLDAVTDNYYNDTGRSVVAYFLGNAQAWRGDVAKRVKLELKAMLKPPKQKPMRDADIIRAGISRLA